MSTFLQAGGIWTGVTSTDVQTIPAFTLTGSNRHIDVSAAGRFAAHTIVSVSRGSDTYASTAGVSVGGALWVRLFTSTNEPQTASASMTVTISASGGTWAALYTACTGVDQTTRHRNTPQVNPDQAGSMAALSVNSAVGDLVMDRVAAGNGQSGLTPSEAGQTQQHKENNTGSPFEHAASTKAGATTATMGWTTTQDSGNSAHIAWSVKAAAVSDPPVITVPGAQNGTLGSQLSVTGVSVADSGGNLSTIRVRHSGVGTCTVTLSGTTVSSGTNGSGDFTLSGTQANLNTAIGTLKADHAENWPVRSFSTTITITATDSNTDSDEETIAVTWTPPTSRYKEFTTDIVASIKALNWQHDTAGAFDFLMRSETSGGLSDEDQFDVTVQGTLPVVTVPVTQTATYDEEKAISGVSVAHEDSLTTSLRFVTEAAQTLNVNAGATGATITGNNTHDVLVEDTHADLNTVAATLKANRATPVAPLPSNLDPATMNTYSIESNLQENDEAWHDLSFTFLSIPAFLLGSAWVKTPDVDKAESGAATLIFDLSFPAWVYVTLDSRWIDGFSFPAWLETWQLVESEIITDDPGGNLRHELYRKSFPAGVDAVTLGGYDFGTLRTNYVVIIQPIEATISIVVTATDSNGNTDVETFDVEWSASGGGVSTWPMRFLTAKDDPTLLIKRDPALFMQKEVAMITDLAVSGTNLTWTIPDRNDPSMYRVFVYYDQAQEQLSRFVELPVRTGKIEVSGADHVLALSVLNTDNLPLGQVNVRVQPIYHEFEGPISNQASFILVA